MDISIKDGLAEVKYNRGRRHFKKTVQLNSLIGAMISEHGVRTPLLPMGTRQYIKEGESHIVLIEVPAMKRGIKYVNRSDKVIFEGKVYESLIDGNTWSPVDYPQGWKEV